MDPTPEQWEQHERDALQARLATGRGGAGIGHPENDRRVLELIRITVAKIDRDPALVRIGLDNINRWTRQKEGYLPRCHAEWKALIEQHRWSELRELLLQETDEGQRLRSSNPFVGIVTPEERAKIYGPSPT